MFKSMRISAVLVCVSVFSLLTACGSGGGGGASSVSAVLTGRFVDSPVEGLRFQSATQSGTTNLNGEFNYLPGETVTFYIGNFVLGSAVGAELITPFELSGISLPVNSADVTRAINQFYNTDYGNAASSLNTAMNLAVFLQTIDLDGYPHDGITIPPALADLLNGKQLDFTQSYWNFENALRALIEPGNATGVNPNGGIWSEYRNVVQPDEALANLYADLKVTPTRSAIVRDARDNNNDGVIDYLQLYAYDARGNQIMDARDRDGDSGTRPLYRNYYDYYYRNAQDRYGEQRETGSETDTNGELPGGVTYRDRSVYFNTSENYRNVQIYEEDEDGDGPLPLTRKIYDENSGNTLVEETDSNGDVAGGVTYRKTNTYSTFGNLVLTLIDADGDGPDGVSARTVYSYDYSVASNGRLTTVVTDALSDDPADDTFRATYTYDTGGRVTLYEEDGDGAGAGGISSRVSYAYDTEGHQILLDRDDNGDTVAGITFHEAWQYDGNGRQVLHETDANGGTVVAITFRETWAYNASGKETLYVRDDNGDTIAGVTYRRQSSYDASNRLTQLIVDNDGDGTNATQVVTTNYAYDANGREILREISSNSVIQSRTKRTYYDNGNRRLEDIEYNPGTPSAYGYRNEYHNFCWWYNTLRESTNNGVVTSRERYTYTADMNCSQLSYERDDDGDGPGPVNRYIGNTIYEIDSNDAAALGVTYRETYTYDPNGHRVRTDIDADGDGVNGISAVTTFTYDANGNRLSENTDGDGAGPGGLTYSAVWTYRGNNEEPATYIVDGDGAGPGGTTYSEIRTYDANGNVILYETFDSTQTPSITRRDRFTYDNGNLTIEEYDSNGDAEGGLSRTLNTYDSAGNVIRVESDEDGNGVVDSSSAYSYADIPVSWSNVLD